jgi:hypothetical protein
LVAARLLKPLGNPQPNSVKYFAAVEVLELAKDRAWLARMTNDVNQHWQKKKRSHKNRGMFGPVIILDRNSMGCFHVQARGVRCTFRKL